MKPNEVPQNFVGIDEIEETIMFNSVKDREEEVVKITTTNPMLISGFDDSLSEIGKTWNSDVKYYLSYLYDKKLVVGQWYDLKDDGTLEHIHHDSNIDLPAIDTSSVVNTSAFNRQLLRWAKLLSQDIPEFRRMAFDIEVEAVNNQLPDPLEAKGRVTAVSFHSNDGLKLVYMLKRDIDLGEADHDRDYEIKWYDSEEKLLEDTFNLIDSYPMILTYNGDQFDMPYLYNRAIKLNVLNNPFIMMKRNATLKTGIHIDMYGVFSNRSLKIYAFNGKYTQEGLDSVSEAMLGENKVEYEGSLDEIPLNLLAKYCYNDSRLTFELSHYNNDLVMNLLVILCRIGNMPIDDISRKSISHWIKSALYNYHITHGELIPRSDEFPQVSSNTTAKVKDKKYEGAIVLTPEKGVHFDVTCMDFASLYPSIIKTRNTSYETIRCPHEECKSNTIPFTNHWSCTKKQGVVSLLIGSLKELRVGHFKKLAKTSKTQKEKDIYDTIAQALKVFLNASYGVIGFEDFPLYYLPVAESITAVGRDIIEHTRDHSKELEMHPIYGDTDSVFFKKPTPDQIELLIKYTKDNYAIDLEVDKEYIYIVLSDRKKNYFGVKTNGDLDIKGLSGKKSNTPPYLREVFADILERLKIIKTPDDFEEIKKEVSQRIDTCVANFDNIPLDKLAFNIMISREPHEYKIKPQALKAAEQLPGTPEKGQFIQFVKTWKDPKVKPLQLTSREDVDKTKYMENLTSTLEQITDPLDIEINMGYGKKTKMDQFF